MTAPFVLWHGLPVNYLVSRFPVDRTEFFGLKCLEHLQGFVDASTNFFIVNEDVSGFGELLICVDTITPRSMNGNFLTNGV